jgi:hypothetical protein
VGPLQLLGDAVVEDRVQAERAMGDDRVGDVDQDLAGEVTLRHRPEHLDGVHSTRGVDEELAVRRGVREGPGRGPLRVACHPGRCLLVGGGP